jgi:hypothetical protein
LSGEQHRPGEGKRQQRAGDLGHLVWQIGTFPQKLDSQFARISKVPRGVSTAAICLVSPPIIASVLVATIAPEPR